MPGREPCIGIGSGGPNTSPRAALAARSAIPCSIAWRAAGSRAASSSSVSRREAASSGRSLAAETAVLSEGGMTGSEGYGSTQAGTKMTLKRDWQWLQRSEQRLELERRRRITRTA